ncbi:MAG: hypothetical protein LBU87_01885 [Lactobacillales bacterium]|jgi:hypothetical protein|nr:hypothetical protein [Lactobacillales bacterium]
MADETQNYDTGKTATERRSGRRVLAPVMAGLVALAGIVGLAKYFQEKPEETNDKKPKTTEVANAEVKTVEENKAPENYKGAESTMEAPVAKPDTSAFEQQMEVEKLAVLPEMWNLVKKVVEPYEGAWTTGKVNTILAMLDAQDKAQQPAPAPTFTPQKSNLRASIASLPEEKRPHYKNIKSYLDDGSKILIVDEKSGNAMELHITQFTQGFFSGQKEAPWTYRFKLSQDEDKAYDFADFVTRNTVLTSSITPGSVEQYIALPTLNKYWDKGVNADLKRVHGGKPYRDYMRSMEAQGKEFIDTPWESYTVYTVDDYGYTHDKVNGKATFKPHSNLTLVTDMDEAKRLVHEFYNGNSENQKLGKYVHEVSSEIIINAADPSGERYGADVKVKKDRSRSTQPATNLALRGPSQGRSYSGK